MGIAGYRSQSQTPLRSTCLLCLVVAAAAELWIIETRCLLRMSWRKHEIQSCRLLSGDNLSSFVIPRTIEWKMWRECGESVKYVLPRNIEFLFAPCHVRNYFAQTTLDNTEPIRSTHSAFTNSRGLNSHSSWQSHNGEIIQLTPIAAEIFAHNHCRIKECASSRLLCRVVLCRTEGQVR